MADSSLSLSLSLNMKEAADSAFRAGDFRQAVDRYADALRADGLDAAARSAILCNRSAALHKLSRYAEAREDAAQAVAHTPGGVKAHYRLACALHALGDHQAALTACNAGLAISSHEQLKSLASLCTEAVRQTLSAPPPAPPPAALSDPDESSAKRAKSTAHAASEGAFAAGAASSVGDDWECLQLPAYACPPKPAWAGPAGLSALQELALSARPDPRKVLLTTRDFVVAYDAYPKARCHLLIMPRTRIDSPAQLTRAHVPMMRAMARLAAWLAPALRTRLLPGLAPLVAGFHSVPSMRQLHLHLISLDFQSEALKHRKHWNSFTSDFLVLPVRWLEALETQGAVMVHVHAEETKLSTEGMRCPLTGTLLKNMPAVKAHVSSAGYQRALAAIDARFEGEPLVGLWPIVDRCDAQVERKG